MDKQALDALQAGLAKAQTPQDIASMTNSPRRYCYRSQEICKAGLKGLPDLSTPKAT